LAPQTNKKEEKIPTDFAPKIRDWEYFLLGVKKKVENGEKRKKCSGNTGNII
jgi:hypothetical protein